MGYSHMSAVAILIFGVNQVLKQQLCVDHTSKMMALLSEASSFNRRGGACFLQNARRL